MDCRDPARANTSAGKALFFRIPQSGPYRGKSSLSAMLAPPFSAKQSPL
jgi:hypothetical protein